MSIQSSHRTTPIASIQGLCAPSPTAGPSQFTAAMSSAFGPAQPPQPAAPVFILLAGTGSDPPTLTELSKLVREMMGAMRVLVDQVQNLSATVTHNNASKTPQTLKDGVVHPKAWTGKGGSAEARHFLAAFHNWASSQGEGLNNYDVLTNQFYIHELRWIQAVLNLIEEDAHTWSLPYLEELGRGNYLFKGDWAKFEDALTKCFMPLDSKEAVREVLKKIQQGKDSVTEYLSKFDQYTMQTGWLDEDHCTCF